jgi:hypothetical protein
MKTGDGHQANGAQTVPETKEPAVSPRYSAQVPAEAVGMPQFSF